MDSLVSFKRSGVAGPPGRGAVLNKSRQQVPPDGASSLNPPRSPRFSDRYRHHPAGPNAVSSAAMGEVADGWYDGKEDAAESV